MTSVKGGDLLSRWMQEDTMSDQGVPQRFLDLAQRTGGPQALSEAGLRERFGDPAQVELGVGQLWRARWEDTSMLVLVLNVESHEVGVVPVTIDPPGEDEISVVVAGSRTAFGVDATVWASLASCIPMRVLERVVDAWGEDLVEFTVMRARGQSRPVPTGVREGLPIRSALEPAAEVRAALADDLEFLQHALGLPVEEDGQPPGTLASLLGDRLDLGTLCAALHLPQPQVMKLLRGKTPLSPDQIDTVASATGLPSAEIAQTVRPLPADLVLVAEHPRWRSVWVRRAQRLGVSETQARLTGGYGAFALAARQTGGEPAAWDARLRQFLQGEDGAEDR
ncbi:hypothetical protein OH768_47035 [Streptomyces sp. NBC_01622]|uniref:hypothetical protein n=1 Tax=Streptomyces sp. NBC_01622 TaxID=2975903 RepID=UPI0038632BF2|nr:hypothetical protein OH768_47035 [Streptomyces sp. NBC_01622]